MTPSLRKLLDWYKTLTPSSLEILDTYYVDDAYFKDPFNEVHTREAILKIFRDMFETLEQPRFVIDDTICEGNKAFIIWRFESGWRGKPIVINGGSHLRFAADGRVEYHRDYWDAAEEIYEKLPVLGWILHRLKKLAKG